MIGPNTYGFAIWWNCDQKARNDLHVYDGNSSYVLEVVIIIVNVIVISSK